MSIHYLSRRHNAWDNTSQNHCFKWYMTCLCALLSISLILKELLLCLREVFGCNHDPTDIDLQSIPVFSEDKVLISYTYNFKCPIVKFRVRWTLRNRVTQTTLLRLPILSSFYLLTAYKLFVNASISRLASLSPIFRKMNRNKQTKNNDCLQSLSLFQFPFLI